jgi:hypothetical protein
VDLDPGTGVDQRTSTSTYSLFLTKLNPDGSYGWSRVTSSVSTSIGTGISIANNGDVYLTGNFGGVTDFDPDGAGDVHGTLNTYGTFLTKINANGSYGWTRITESPWYYGWGRTISLDSSQNIYLTGTFSASANFDPEGAGDIHTAVGGRDIFMSKINADGSYAWTETMGDVGFDMGHSVVVDGSDNVYFTGHYQNTVDLDPTAGVDLRTSTDNSEDTFIIKLNSAGVYQWTQTMGGSLWNGSYEIDVDDAGNVYITGLFEGTTDLDPTAGIDTHTSIGNVDLYVTKLNADGSYGWSRAMGESSTFNNWGNYIAVAGNGTVYATSCYSGIRDFDFTVSGFDYKKSGGYVDIFVTQINTDGSYGWTKVVEGGANYDCSTSSAVDNGGNLYISGLFSGVADFDPAGVGDVRTPVGGNDIFVTRFESTISGGDTVPPITTATVDRGTYRGTPYFDITRVVNEPAVTWFMFTGDGTITTGGINTSAWQVYIGPIHIDGVKKGTANFDFYSEDTAGNQETIRTEVLE